MDNKRHSQWLLIGKNKAAAIYLILIVIGINACSSTGHNAGSEITVPKTVRHPASMDSRLAPHYHIFVSILQSNGFEVGQTDDPRALQLRLEFDRNPSALELVTSLWQEETALLSVRASSGDVALVGSSHSKVLAQRAAGNFEKKLVELRPNLSIVADKPLSDVTRQN